jgi:alkanesulfonate monooxygenase SsuD/methylene tetrahydromethanopterin reductase-like flavin-dependent oxidoreductase (luciferase family)
VPVLPRIGLQLPEVERVVGWPEYAAMAVAAEAAGFDSLWVGDHLLYRGDGREERAPWDAWTLLSALAAVTRRVELGPLVACTAFEPPGMLARRAAAVQEVSGGRLVLGLGAGWNEVEFRAFGLPFDRRASRFLEAFDVIRRLLAGERVTHASQFARTEDLVLLPRPARPPQLLVGSVGRRVMRETVAYADAWNFWHDWYGNSSEGFAEHNAHLDRVARGAGRDPRTLRRTATVHVAVSDEPGDRPHVSRSRPVRLPELRAHLTELAGFGLNEAILVVTPITHESVERLAPLIRGG